MKLIKKSNRTRILECIFRAAPISRVTIAEQTDITPATVTTTTAELINEGVIINLGEVEQSENTPGRRRVLIDLNPDYRYAIGIEFNEKYVAFCVTNLRGEILVELIFSTTYREIANITEFIIKNVENIIEDNKSIKDKIIGIGIGVPGKISSNHNELFADSDVWKYFSPKIIIDKFRMPVVMDNNVRCMAMGVYLFGSQKIPESFSFFHLGTGMYCANMINGDLFKGESYIAGEIGHTIVKMDGKLCECGKNGCLNTYTSERWLIKMSKLLLQNNASIILKGLVKDEESLGIEHIIAAYNLGDEIIMKYISDGLKCLSMTISNLSITMNLIKIFLHGRLFEDEMILKQFKMYIEKDLNFIGEDYFSNIEIIKYSPVNGAVGASARVIDTYFINE